MAIKKITDDDVQRVARSAVDESAANTFTQIEIDTQLSIERGVVWLIDRVEMHFDTLDLMNELIAGGNEVVEMQLTRESKTAIVQPHDADSLQYRKSMLSRSAAIGTDAGPLYFGNEEPRVFKYDVPLIYAGQSIFVSIFGTDSANAHRGSIKIFYRIASVSDKFFFRVAQALS